MSVFAISVDAPELLTAIADKAGIKPVVDDSVSRKITIYVEKRPAAAILDAIVSAYGLSRAERKIPGLGDLPLVGQVFKSQKRNQVQTELVIFLTPKILAPDQNDAPRLPK